MYYYLLILKIPNTLYIIHCTLLTAYPESVCLFFCVFVINLSGKRVKNVNDHNGLCHELTRQGISYRENLGY